jgi:hypothetical protein
MNAASTIQGSAIFNKIKLNALAPYLIANKGALVSGGAFQFDADGNGYTDNYFPLNQELQIGTWMDGKPIYQRTIEFALMNFLAENDNIIIYPVSIISNFKNLIDSKIFLNTYGEANHWLVMTIIDNNFVLTNIGPLSGTIPSIYCTLKYTKTTD